jgi:hypothetical protein
MRAIGAAHGALKAPAFESLHPDRDANGISVEKLDTIVALIEEHEPAAIAYIALKVILDDAVLSELPHTEGKPDRFPMFLSCYPAPSFEGDWS